eukprot:Gb_00519 [translate_table: standard]
MIMDNCCGHKTVTNGEFSLEVSRNKRQSLTSSSQEHILSLFKPTPKNSPKDSCEAVIPLSSDQSDGTEALTKSPFRSDSISLFLQSLFSFNNSKEMNKTTTSENASSNKRLDILPSGVRKCEPNLSRRCMVMELWRFRSEVNVVGDPYFRFGQFMPPSPVISTHARLILGLNGLQTHCNDATSKTLDIQTETRNSGMQTFKDYASHFFSLLSPTFRKNHPGIVAFHDCTIIQGKKYNGDRVKLGEIWFPFFLDKVSGGRQNLPLFARLKGGPHAFLSEAFRNRSEIISTVMKLPKLPSPAMSITGLMEIIPDGLNLQQTFPNKRELSSAQEFFHYAELEGKRLFQELDRDGDGLATLRDIKEAIRRRKLPSFYASEFLSSAKKHWLSRSFGWDEFSSMIKEKEPKMLSAFNSVRLCNSGTIQKSELKALLQNAKLPATEPNIIAMMKFLDADKDGSVSYSQFRKFMLFVPTDLIVNDPWTILFKAATLMPPTIPVQAIPTISTGLSTAGMNSTFQRHSCDTSKGAGH